MNRSRLGIAAAFVVLIMSGVAAAVAVSLPADAVLPIHWDIMGEPDGFAGKWIALLLAPLLAAAVSTFFFFLPAMEPRDQNLSRSGGLYVAASASVLLVLIAVEAITISVALGWHWRVMHVLCAALGAMFVLIGNQLGKSRSMYLVGIRTPWTLASEEVWIQTHRLGGKLMVGGGLLLLLQAFLPIPSGPFAATMAAIVAVMVGVPVAYSYLLWRRETRRQAGPDAT